MAENRILAKARRTSKRRSYHTTINELRYASRQLYNAIKIYDKEPLNEAHRSIINKRITIAEQYLFNAEHDISDSIVTFYRAVVSDIEKKYGRNLITSHFPEYPAFRLRIKSCEALIADARENYEKRAQNYNEVRKDHLEQMILLHEKLIDAQVSAAEEHQRTANALRMAEGRASLGFWITIFSVPLAILGIWLAVYLWIVTPERYCVLHKTTPILNLICTYK
jgi:hypothetical protein